MAYSALMVDTTNGVATITLNRPEKLNAYNAAMGAELSQAFATLDGDDQVRVIVVTGAGRAFCAGADLSTAGGDTFNYDKRRERGELREAPAIRPWNMKKPIIAAINGPAVGVGITLPMQWDIRVAAESARIGFVFVRRGVIPEALSLWTLPRQIGLARANELLMTGKIISPREMAEDIALNTAPVSVAITKRLTWGLLGEDEMEKAQSVDSRAFQWTGKQPDSHEGVSAFLEKRKPAWKMKPSKDFPDFLPQIK